MADRPLLLRAANAVDRRVGGPLESLADHKRFVDVVTLTLRLEHAAQGAFERRTRKFLHFWNVPAQTDIKRLTRQVSVLGSEVRALAAQLQDERDLARDGAQEQAADPHKGRA
jgi:hypothetical protein